MVIMISRLVGGPVGRLVDGYIDESVARSVVIMMSRSVGRLIACRNKTIENTKQTQNVCVWGSLHFTHPNTKRVWGAHSLHASTRIRHLEGRPSRARVQLGGVDQAAVHQLKRPEVTVHAVADQVGVGIHEGQDFALHVAQVSRNPCSNSRTKTGGVKERSSDVKSAAQFLRNLFASSRVKTGEVK